MSEHSDFGTFGKYMETPVGQMFPETRDADELTKKLRGIVPGPHRIRLANPKLFWTKLLAFLTTLKAIIIVVAVAFATGNWLPAILISLLFNLAQLGAKPVGETTPQDTVLVPPNDGAAAGSRAISDSPIL